MHNYRRPNGNPVRHNNGPQASEIAAIISGAENGIIKRQEIVIRWSGKLDESGTERILQYELHNGPMFPCKRFVCLICYGKLAPCLEFFKRFFSKKTIPKNISFQFLRKSTIPSF